MEFWNNWSSSYQGSTSSFTSDFTQALQVLVTASTIISPSWPPNAKLKGDEEFDFIVVGAGSAGAVIANRLTEISDWKVLLIECGNDPNLFSVIPAAMTLLPGTRSDWGYFAEDDGMTAGAQKKKGRIAHTRGKMLGGSSSINYMFYVRGNELDYDKWSKAGFEGWDWKSVLPYFKKSEKMVHKSTLEDETVGRFHSSKGPLEVSKPDIIEKMDIFMDAFDEIGIKKIMDYNGPNQFGIGRSYFTHSQPPGIRYSTAQAFLIPIAKKRNLFVLKDACATKILLTDNKEAYGVEVIVNNKNYMKFYATREVIVSAGTFNTPKLLIASGIGPKDVLKELKIDEVCDLPVGSDMADHLVVPILFTGKNDLKTIIPPLDLNTLPMPNLTGFYSAISNSTTPDFQLLPMWFGIKSIILMIACHFVFNFNTEVCNRMFEINKHHEIFLVYLIFLHPKSRGRVEVKSIDPSVPPKIYTGFFSNPDDVITMRNGIKRILNLTETSYLKESKSFIPDLQFKQCKNSKFLSNNYWDCYMKTAVNTLYHPMGTCAMGKVVDSQFNVKGVKYLRVIDASTIPVVISGNINAPTIMMAEKGADFIKNDNKKVTHTIKIPDAVEVKEPTNFYKNNPFTKGISRFFGMA